MKAPLLVVLVVACTAFAASSARGAGDPVAGKARAQGCAGCHGANGEGVGKNPALAGKRQALFAQQMQEYKSGKRNSAVMKPFASKLSDDDIENLAAYYASLKGKP